VTAALLVADYFRLFTFEERILTQRGSGGMIRLTSVEKTSDIKD
jgi:hypothetical protein